MGIIWTDRNPQQPVLKRTVDSKLNLGPVSIKFITVLIIAILSIFYLFQSNASATKAYLVKELEQKKENLEAQNDQLQYEAERLKSLNKAETEAKKQGLVDVNNIDADVSE